MLTMDWFLIYMNRCQAGVALRVIADAEADIPDPPSQNGSYRIING
ncbi:hypothetical protein PC128_g17150 [Phytophthora cactorum]|nr:hypothetical protein C6341_g16332 [Phytophthora cactorum]KAG3176765.1 hypothetical protein PC128_g17150 [Phytophthora cactorum]